MTHIVTSAYIAVPAERVFTYVTTPGNWPDWHPSSLVVSGASDHTLGVGEQCVEEFLVAGRRGKVTWTVTECTFPRNWAITGIIEGRNSGGAVRYTVQPQGEGTHFEREFVYPTPGLWLTLLDWLVVRRRIQAESQLAVRQLKDMLEQGPATF